MVQAVFQLNVQLNQIEPLIWRRIVVPAAITLNELHVVLQGAMGWQDYHLHMFEIGSERYEIPENDEFGPERGARDERLYELNDLLKTGQEFSYTYEWPRK
ncbi:MAG: plasmid pRiA4b ORF-3 family protein [Alphaproteobacteria bacterium]|jgi:hypothetical protein|nr:plasmid pRiA4b ORF-3 family protein [Alphaproteobacteria bacterium]